MKYVILLLLSFSTLLAESFEDHLFPVKLSIDSSSGLKFKFEWKQDTNSLRYNISRKLLGASSFGNPIATLGHDATSFEDSNVKQGLHYEYKIENYQSDVSTFTYLAAGVDISLPEKHSLLLLIADNTTLPQNFIKFKSLISTEVQNIHQRMVPASIDFNKNKVQQVKSVIREEFLKDKSIKYIILIGNIPIPYSGNYTPDGHNEHIGAFPADIWYAELDGDWTDSIIDADSATAFRQHNFPGDGKFDNDYLPSSSDFIISRIDFRNLTDFPESESQLLERYFEKNIRYRTGEYKAKEKAFISDGFGSYGGFPATTIYNQFSTLYGKEQITIKNMRDSMSSGNYAMAYACAPGGYNSVYLTLYAHDLAEKDYDAVFLSCFGSWLCDWDSENNLLRAAIASRPSVLCSWFGNRPQVPLHNLGLGRTIGEQIYTAQNNKTLYEYWYNGAMRTMHLNLFGDPTLKLRHIKMPNNLDIARNDEYCELKWRASEDADYYNIYRSVNQNSIGEQININPVYDLSYNDYIIHSGKSYYTVKAVKKISTKSGSYYLESSGIRDSLDFYPSKNLSVFIQNPIYSSDNIYAKVILQEKSTIEFTIYDIEGKAVYTANSNDDELNHTLNIGNEFGSGVYILNIKTQTGLEKNRKFTIIR